jgi:glycosyltransferase involved in cell wall biosynthesis
MKTICLCMIVKNESKIIERCLAAVKDIIDYWIIVDTGSTDNTKEVIREYLKDIDGELHDCPWVNFAHNRNESLRLAAGKSDYILLCDADEEFVFDKSFNKEDLSDDAYMIRYAGSLDYCVKYLIKDGLDWKYVGVTHEYITSTMEKTTGELKGSYINHYVDGGSRSDKFERDVRLLKKGLKDEPNNDRYMFYLAQSYRDLGNNQKALEWYKKSAEKSHWCEQIFYSWDQAGMIASKIKRDAEAVNCLLKAYNCHSCRAESLYHLALHYRERGMHEVAYFFAQKGLEIPYPSKDILFIEKFVYDWGLLFEISISSFYIGKYAESLSSCDKLLAMDKLPGNIREATIRNREFPAEKLGLNINIESIEKFKDKSIDIESMVGVMDGFNNSTPCIIKYKDGYLLNVRRVSYSVSKEDNSYRAIDGKNIDTINTLVELNENFEPVSDLIDFHFDTENKRSPNGIEDLRLHLLDDGNLIYSGNTWKNDSIIRVVYGHVDWDSRSFSCPIVLESPNNFECEKNWSFLNYDGSLKCLYGWQPIEVYDISGNVLENKKIIADKGFSSLRGSSNGVVFEDAIYFLTHTVKFKGKVRDYYHHIIKFDLNTLNFISLSDPFKIEGELIEYALGLIIDDEKVVITYSTWDSSSNLKTYKRENLFRSINI